MIDGSDTVALVIIYRLEMACTPYYIHSTRSFEFRYDFRLAAVQQCRRFFFQVEDCAVLIIFLVLFVKLMGHHEVECKFDRASSTKHE